MSKFRRILTFILAMTISLGVVTDVARAQEERDPDYWSGNDILFYDPTSLGACTGSGSLVGASTKEKVWNYLTGKGLTPEQAAGIMGNMQAESGVNPTRRQGTSDLWNSNYNNNAWGLVQWDGGRRYSAPEGGVLGKLRKEKPELEKYTAASFDTARNPDAIIPPADFDALLLFELDYMYDESQSRRVTEKRYGEAANEWETLKLQNSVEDATVFWHNNFEVSADSPEQVLASRGGAAQGFYDDFSRLDPSGSGDTTRCVGTGNLAKTVTSYAWPEYRANYQPRTEDYILAVIRATAEGRYTGDSCYGGGVDCGAFTTMVMVDSGWDPEFNHGGLLRKGASYTAVQQAWAEANWEKLEPKPGEDSINVADLEPGDVAFKPGHTFMFIGDETYPNGVPGFETKIASASQCQRAPMSGREKPDAPDVTWYRKKE